METQTKIRLGLFSRMLTALFILLVSTLAILSSSLLQNASNQFDEFRLNNALSLARTLSDGSLDALITEDYELLERFVRSSLPSHYGAYATLSRPNGQVLSSTDLNLIGKSISTPNILDTFVSRTLHYKNRPVIEVVYKSIIGHKHLAYAHIAYYTDKGSFNYLAQAKNIIIYLIIVLIFILVGTYLIVSRIKTPILSLINTVENTSLDNPISLPQKMYFRSDEVGVLARAFDRVFNLLSTANKEVQNARDNLELRVEKRTQELDEKNKELSAEKLRIDTIINNAGDSIITIDNEGIIQSCNIATRKLFGYEVHELIGQNVKILMPESDQKNHDNHIRRYQSEGVSQVVGKGQRELLGKRKDNALFPLELVVNKIKLNDNDIIIGIARDITLQKEAKENLIKTNELLEEKVNERTQDLLNSNKDLLIAHNEALEASKLKTEFISNISHELRTPLHAISGYGDLLSISELDEKQAKYCDNIKIGSGQLLEIITGILDFSTYESGKSNVEKQSLNVKETLEMIYDEYSPKVQHNNLSFSCHIADNIPTTIETDPQRLKQTIDHLLNNAFKFTQQGSIEINASLSTHVIDNKTSPQPCLKISIIDTGLGIKEDNFTRIYTAFYQVDGSMTRKQGGTGLGLAIVKQFVELMGGEIVLKSDIGKGSEFSILLPINDHRHV